jgi:hypothetical protein
MSNLSELLPTGGGQNAVDFVASGTLSSGQTVILNTDGTVAEVVSAAQGVGSPTVFESALASPTAAVFDHSANKVVIAYSDFANASYGTAVVGTVSGTSISFGSPVVFSSTSCSYIAATFDSSSNKVVIAYRDGGNSFYGTAVVGTVSGTSISFGSAVVFESANTTFIGTTFDASNGKVVIAYRNGGNSNYGTAVVGTVSGTSISFGSAVVFAALDADQISIAFDSNSNKIIIAYRNNNTLYGTAIVGTVSGTSISFGSSVVFEAANADGTFTTFDSNSNKVVIAYKNDGNSGYGTAIVGTVSGTSISFGSAVVFESAGSEYISSTFDSNANKVVIAYRDSSNSGYGTLSVGTVSGTSISFGSAVVFESAGIIYAPTTFDSTSNKVVIGYRDQGNSNYGTAVVFQNASSNSADFIGITAEAISDTATGAVNVYGGINEAQTGLTIGADYYVQDDGSLSTTASTVKVGQAISATTINMMDLT